MVSSSDTCTPLCRKFSGFLENLTQEPAYIVSHVKKIMHEQQLEMEIQANKIANLKERLNKQEEQLGEDITKNKPKEVRQFFIYNHKTQTSSPLQPSEIIDYATQDLSELIHTNPRSNTNEVKAINWKLKNFDLSNSCPLRFNDAETCTTPARNKVMTIDRTTSPQRVYTSSTSEESAGRSINCQKDSCREPSPLRLKGFKLRNQIDKEINDDDAICAAYQIHAKTQLLHAKLATVLFRCTMCGNTDCYRNPTKTYLSTSTENAHEEIIGGSKIKQDVNRAHGDTHDNYLQVHKSGLHSNNPRCDILDKLNEHIESDLTGDETQTKAQ